MLSVLYYSGYNQGFSGFGLRKTCPRVSNKNAGSLDPYPEILIRKFTLLETPGYWVRDQFLAVYKPEHRSRLHPLSNLCFRANCPAGASVIWSVKWGYETSLGRVASSSHAWHKVSIQNKVGKLTHFTAVQLPAITLSSEELWLSRVGCGGICLSLHKPGRRKQREGYLRA